MVGTKLFIGNLPDTVNSNELKEMFQKFGNVVEFDILKDYGFVHYEKESEAKAACDSMDGQVHRGSNIRVEVSRSRVRQKAGMGGKGECYRCGAEGHWSKECPRGPTRSRGGGGRGASGGVSRGVDRYSPYAREPYYPPPPESYDHYARARAPLPPLAYDRYRMADLDRLERRLPPLPPRSESIYRDYSDRPGSDYYRRASPTPRDPYYDYYERRRLESEDQYRDKLRASASLNGSYAGAGDMSMSRGQMSARVPGPY